MIAKQSKSKSKSKSSLPRKSRTKLRKPKFLSLRLQLTATTPSPPMPTTDHHKQLINLFPLHPENLTDQDRQDKLDVEEHDNMACIFSTCDDVDGPTTTLTGILCSDDDDGEEQNTNNPSPSSVNYADEEVKLVRTAMRRNKRERDDHEKWVCYSEVVERKKLIGGMSSSSSSSTSCFHHHRSKLVLKLDYEKVIKSWVNKGPLYIHSNSDPGAPQPQTVPDLQDDDFFFPSSVNCTTKEEQENGGNGGSWTVPEIAHFENNDRQRDDALQAGESSVMVHNREASVQRYKEKRRNRLFAKTIRYEVRKLNAEKRPRVKGRFVKRN